jgi:hypothetical protein
MNVMYPTKFMSTLRHKANLMMDIAVRLSAFTGD